MAPSINWVWQDRSGGKDVALAAAINVDGSSVHAGYTFGNWNATMATDDDFMFWKYYSAAFKLDVDGTLLWKYQNGTSGHDKFHAVAAGQDGSYILAGSSDFDFAVVKLNADGNTLWQFQDGTDGKDVAHGVAISPENGSVVVVGRTDGDWEGTSSGKDDFAAFKLDFNGTLIWKWQDGTNDWELRAVALVDGGAVTCGFTGGSFGGPSIGARDFVAFKLDAAGGGAELWRWQSGSSLDDDANAIVAVGSGDVVVAGKTNGGFNGDNANEGASVAGRGDFAAVKLNGTNGNEVWRWQDGTEDHDEVAGAAVLADGTIVLGGTTYEHWELPSVEQAGVSTNYIAIYLTQEGQELVSFQDGADNGGDAWVNDLTASLDGTVILAGRIGGSNPPEVASKTGLPFFNDFFVVSLSTSTITEVAPKKDSSAEALRAVVDSTSPCMIGDMATSICCGNYARQAMEMVPDRKAVLLENLSDSDACLLVMNFLLSKQS